MENSPVMYQMRCPQCEWRKRFNLNSMIAELERLGMLRRSKENDPAVIVELFLAAVPKMTCPDCDASGLTAQKYEPEKEDWGDWPAGKKCAACGNEIPPERLEIFPDEKVCATCKGAGKTGTDEAREYCDFCGAVMVMRQRGGSGLAGYKMVCSECGK